MRDPYRFMGHIYEIIGTLYSGRRIPMCKEAMLEKVKSGDRLLFAGVGHGTEAIRAAEKGARVTVVDFSETMLSKFEKGIAGKKFKYPVTKICSDIFKIPTKHEYDFVFANFFLNVFPRQRMDNVVNHLAALVKPGGYLIVGDFCYPEERGLYKKVFQNLNWFIGVMPFFLTTGNAFHRIYNYPLYIKKNGLTVETINYFKLFNTNLYWSLLAKKPLVG